ncbi:MAG TPA: hypothetical protein VFW62_02075, partial [bacterium]|nr:hypothetical protein [bacterium]
MDRRVDNSSHSGSGFGSGGEAHAAVVRGLQTLPGLSSSEQAELGSLAPEADAEIFWTDLLRIGLRLQQKDKLEAARAIYGRIQEEAKEASIRDKARQALEAVEGRGAVGGRAEFLLSRFAKEASDPGMILPMLAGTAVYQLAKGAVLGRMAAAANPAWWMRGASGRFAASAMAYTAEVPTFALSGRLLRSFGDPSQPLPNLGQDLGSAAITLGLLKLSGATSQSLLTKTLGQKASPLTRVATAQATMFGSLLAAHRLETGIGLRPEVDGATEMTDILSSMVSLGVGASLGQRVLGRSYQGFMQKLGLRLQPEATSKWGSFGPELAFASSSFRSGLGKEDLFQPITAYPKGEGGSPPRPQTLALRGYQLEMLTGLRRDLQQNESSWLGLASPMQTGKSHLIPHIISMAEEVYGKNTEFIILSSARVITRQILGDLLGGFDPSQIGRLDGQVKDPKRITVASLYTLYKKSQLNRFPLDGRKRVILMDEAYFTQAPVVRRILTHFGLAQEVQVEGRPRIIPQFHPNSRLIGFSGTGEGLSEYRVSGHLNLLDAVEGGWVRRMLGE